MESHGTEAQRKYTKQNRRRRGKISCVCVVKSVKAEWDVVKRAKGYTSNNEMVKHMLRGLKRAKNAPPKCSETNSVVCGQFSEGGLGRGEKSTRVQDQHPDGQGLVA